MSDWVQVGGEVRSWSFEAGGDGVRVYLNEDSEIVEIDPRADARARCSLALLHCELNKPE